MSKTTAKRRAKETRIESVDEIIAELTATDKATATRLAIALKAERKAILNDVCDFYITASVERNKLDRFCETANKMVESLKLKIYAMREVV